MTPLLRKALSTQHVTTDVVGYVQEATTEQVEQALNNAQAVQDIWARTAKDTRASYLLRAADLMEARLEELMVLLCRESGKTLCQCYCRSS